VREFALSRHFFVHGGGWFLLGFLRKTGAERGVFVVSLWCDAWIRWRTEYTFSGAGNYAAISTLFIHRWTEKLWVAENSRRGGIGIEV
jgi:hypothetical protein